MPDARTGPISNPLPLALAPKFFVFKRDLQLLSNQHRNDAHETELLCLQ